MLSTVASRRVFMAARPSARFFATSQMSRDKTLTEKAKSAAENVNKGSGKTVAAGIEAAENATQKVKEVAKSALGQAENVKDDAKAELAKKSQQAKDGARVAKDKANEAAN